MKKPWGAKLAPVQSKPQIKTVVQKAKARAQEVGIKDEIDHLLREAAQEYESFPPHRRFYEWGQRQDSYSGALTETITPARRATADLISSETADGQHAPLFDIDLPCRLYPSGTEGHFHLYIDKEMKWEKFDALLKAFVDAGIVEPQYYEMAKKRKAAYLRLPEKPKTDADRAREDELKRKKSGSSAWNY